MEHQWHSNTNAQSAKNKGAKFQGLPVTIWGLFANGRLEYYVLPSDGGRKAKAKAEAKARAKAKAKGKAKKKRKQTGTENMTIQRYVDLVNSQFKDWRKKCFGDHREAHLVQDHEACLWNERFLAALKAAGFSVLDNYPIASPDLNAIEGWWRRLLQRLHKTAPTEMESRPEFLVRLRRAVNWLGEHAEDDALKQVQKQKERAKAVKLLRGARCKW